VLYSIKNITNQPVDVSLLGVLRKPLAARANDRKLTNTVESHGHTAYLTMRTGSEEPVSRSSAGSICFSV
jgi:hypothetical protein